MINVNKLRSEFPILSREVNGKQLVYLDNGASSQKPQVVIDAVSNAYSNEYSNVHRGLHYLSNLATDKYEKEIIKTFIQSDISMTQRLFRKNKLDDSQYKTLQNLGISLTIPDKFNTVDDTGEFLWLRHHLTSGIAKTGSNNILVYSVPLEAEAKVSDSIITIRNRIGKKYIPGSDPETMYMITEKAYTPFTFEANIDGKKAYETRGKWEVKNDFMAGPFLNYTILDPNNNRLIVFEGFTYAPSVSKRAFLFELEAIAKSIKIQ